MRRVFLLGFVVWLSYELLKGFLEHSGDMKCAESSNLSQLCEFSFDSLLCCHFCSYCS